MPAWLKIMLNKAQQPQTQQHKVFQHYSIHKPSYNLVMVYHIGTNKTWLKEIKQHIHVRQDVIGDGRGDDEQNREIKEYKGREA